jgi:hypothetical protein
MIKEALMQNSGFQLMVLRRSIGNNENFNWLIDLAKIHSNIVIVAESFTDFAINYPELKSYSQEENNKIIILSKEEIK